MAQGETLEEAVADAQPLGIAEADPSNDLEGWDASVKATVLANVLMGADLRPADVRREGLGAEAMRRAQAALLPGQTLKQVAEAERDGDAITARVRLVALPPRATSWRISRGWRQAYAAHRHDGRSDADRGRGWAGPDGVRRAGGSDRVQPNLVRGLIELMRRKLCAYPTSG